MGSSNSKSGNRWTEESEMNPQRQNEEERRKKGRERVRQKLLKSGHALTPEQLEEMVLVLSDRERMKERYFRPVLKSMDDAVASVADEKGAHAHGIRNRRGRDECIERLLKEFDNVQHVEVRLVLCQLNRELAQNLARTMNRYVKNLDYGPFHAALVIGGVVLEWDDSSLVIPRPATAKDDWIFRGSVHQPVVGSGSFLKDLPLRAGAAETEKHFDTIIEQLTNVKKEKQQLVDELVDVAVRYNTKHTYGLFSHNCQFFVQECLQVLGIRDKAEMFKGRLREHAEVLMKEGLVGSTCEEFNSHQELDDYVRQNLQTMNPSELELCICHYLIFHAFHKASPKEAWQCQSHTCLQSHVEKRLQDSKRTELK